MVIEATAEQDDLSASVKILADLTSDPGFEADLRDIFDGQFRNSVTVDTFLELMSHLEEYFDDPDLAMILLGALGTTPEDDPDLANALENVGDTAANERLFKTLRRLRAFYAPFVAQTLRMFNEHPDDWMAVAVEPAYLLSRDSWILAFAVTKYSLEEFTISTSPTSAVNLAQYILASINALPPTDSDDEIIDPAALEAIENAYEAFRDRFTSDG